MFSVLLDELWILLSESVVNVLSAMPKCNLSPSVYKDLDPSLRTGSPFRPILRILLTTLERYGVRGSGAV